MRHKLATVVIGSLMGFVLEVLVNSPAFSGLLRESDGGPQQALDSEVLSDIGQLPTEFVLTANIYSDRNREVKVFLQGAGIFLSLRKQAVSVDPGASAPGKITPHFQQPVKTGGRFQCRSFARCTRART